MPPPGRTWLRTLLSKELPVGSLFADTMNPAGGLTTCGSSRNGTISYGSDWFGCGLATGSHSLPPVPSRSRYGGFPCDRPGLQVLADRHLGVGEVGDVALDVGVDEVLRAEVEVLQRVAEVVDVAREVDPPERVELGGRREAGVLHRQRRCPPARSTESSGPLLRRGTMSVCAGIAPPGGTTSSASCRPGVRGLTRNVSSMATTGSSRPLYRVDSPLGDAGSGRICSTYVSVTSAKCVGRAERDVPVLAEDEVRRARRGCRPGRRSRRPRGRSG